MWTRKSRPRGDKLVTLTTCPASRSLGLGLPVSTPGDSAVERWVGTLALGDDWVPQDGDAKRGFRHLMRVVLSSVSQMLLMEGLISGYAVGSRGLLLVY